MTGIVKWFKEKVGYGFICPDDKGPDIFVHGSDVEGEILDGQHVEFDLEQGPKGPKARNVKVAPQTNDV